MTIGRIPSVEGGIQPTILDAKGDLIVATAADTPARLAVGSANQVLTVDSSTATGLKWASAATAFSGVSVKSSALQSISNATATAVTFNQENFDTDSFHDNATNNTRITIPTGKGGYYLINGSCTLDTSATTGNHYLYVRKNGTGNALAGSLQAVNRPAIGVVNFVANLAAGDYIELMVYQNTGSSQNTLWDSTYGFTYFSVNFLGA